MAGNLATDVPMIDTPFTRNDGVDGYITEAWFLLLIQLVRRTGGGSGGGGTTLTIQDVLALEQVTMTPLDQIKQEISSLAMSLETLAANIGKRDEAFATETTGV